MCSIRISFESCHFGLCSSLSLFLSPATTSGPARQSWRRLKSEGTGGEPKCLFLVLFLSHPVHFTPPPWYLRSSIVKREITRGRVSFFRCVRRLFTGHLQVLLFVLSFLLSRLRASNDSECTRVQLLFEGKEGVNYCFIRKKKNIERKGCMYIPHSFKVNVTLYRYSVRKIDPSTKLFPTLAFSRVYQ